MPERLALSILLTATLCFWSPHCQTFPDPPTAYISELGLGSGALPMFLDEDEEVSDWIEVHNPTTSAISLENWSLSDNPTWHGEWFFPNVTIPADGYLTVFANGKDRSPSDGGNLHTNFGLAAEGEYLGLFDPLGQPSTEFSPSFPAQYASFSYGYDRNTGTYRYMNPTPGGANETTETFDTVFDRGVSFSNERGYYDSEIEVELSTTISGAVIRYTTDGTTPGWATGTLYTTPIPVNSTTFLRAVALVPGVGLSKVETHTYLFGLTDRQLSLPGISVVADDENFSGPYGIIRSANTDKHGRTWERPASVEFLELSNEGEFQKNCGIRLHGGHSRNSGKKSYRLYFRDEYGHPELVYPLFAGSEVEEFKRIVLRSGAQDLNPFVLDELARRLMGDLGHPTSHGTFVQMFRNGTHLGHYNPTERYDRYFFQSWYGGDNDWDVIRADGVKDGDNVAWQSLISFATNNDLTSTENYREMLRRLDMPNFVDYLLLNIMGATQDWPGNNWAVARERVEGGKFHFHVWDAEQSFGGSRNRREDNTIVDQLEAGNGSIQTLYRRLHENPDFRSLFADRYRKHFFENGGLTDSNMMFRFLELKAVMVESLPTMLGALSGSWVPGRRYNMEKFLREADLFDLRDFPVSTEPRQGKAVETDVQIPQGSEDLTGDRWIDSRDIIEFQGQEDRFGNQASLIGRSFRDDSWERHDYTISRGARSVVSADFDQNGVLDLAIGNVDFGTIDILSGRGDGTFGKRRGYETRPGLTALAVGDFNGDLIPDLAAANDFMLEHSVYVFSGNADGSFTMHESVRFNDTDATRHLHPRSILPRDLDLDGDLDLLVQNESSVHDNGQPIKSAVSILRNEGNAQFVAADAIYAGSAALTSPNAMIAEDLNGDGFLDLVVLAGDDRLLLLEGKESGAFDPPSEIPSPSSSYQLVSVAGADFDGDGDTDLAACNSRGRSVYFYLNDGTAGFALDEGRTTSLSGPEYLLPGDYNSDGIMDLLVSNFQPFLLFRSFFQILSNDGNGSFNPLGEYTTADREPIPKSFVTEDFDNDGDSDLAAVDEVNGRLTVFLNQIVPSPPSADINGDGSIGLLDLAVIGDRWQMTTRP